MTEHGLTTWGRGVTIGLTPAGARNILGVAAAELKGETLKLADVLGLARATELTERLAERAGGVDEVLGRWSRRHEQPITAAAWERLQDASHRYEQPVTVAAGGRAASHRDEQPVTVSAGERAASRRHEWPVAAVAWERLQTARTVSAVADDLGVSRRYLERVMQRDTGLTPGAVARIARFQRVLHRLAAGTPLAETAAACGYTDQSHLSRDTRSMTGLTPAALAAIVQYPRAGARLPSAA